MNSILRYLLLISSLFFCNYLFADDPDKWLSPETVKGTETINLEQAKAMYADGVKFIDVRSPRQYNKRHISGAIHLYIDDGFTKENLLKQVKSNETFIVYCNGIHCSHSYKAAEKAVGWGFTDIKYYRDGFRVWRLDGNPIEYGTP